MLTFQTLKMEICVICNSHTGEKLTKLTDVGLATLRSACELRDRPDIDNYLSSSPSSVFVHHSCRRSFTRCKELKKLRLQLEVPQNNPVLRSQSTCFQWKTMCFLCALPADDSADVRRVCTLELGGRILEKCAQRCDDWSLEIRSRLESCNDLVAEEGRYHRLCHNRFWSDLPCVVGAVDCGRPAADNAMTIFEKMCYVLETTCEENAYTMDGLHELMSSLCTGDPQFDIYSAKHVKRLLKERYGDRIFFAEVSGRKNVICFRDLSNLIVSDKWYVDKLAENVDVRDKIVRDAARLIADEIRQIPSSTSIYPTTEDISTPNDQLIPPLLATFMQSLVRCKLKQSALSQALIQASRPQSIIMPLLFGLGVQLDHEFGSKFLLQVLSRLGFSVSYDEVTRFKMSVMQSHSDAADADDHVAADVSFAQYVADNIDHNMCTIDGYNTFHGMGMIAASVVDNVLQYCSRPVQRLSKRCKMSDVCNELHVKVTPYYLQTGVGLSSVTIRKTVTLQSPVTLPPIWNLNIIWHMYGLRQQQEIARPNWSGFMQTVCTGDHVPAASLQLLPIIDLKPTDETCMYSTLLFIIDQYRKFRDDVPCVTFDQPLYVKAIDIATAAKLNIVCRLGGFHTVMNFLGAIGYIMAGSGLESLLELMYGPNTVQQVLTGKAYARAVRGHFIIQDALLQLVLQRLVAQETLDNSSTVTESMLRNTTEEIQTTTVDVMHQLYGQIWQDRVDVGDDCILQQCEALSTVASGLQNVMIEMMSESRTSRLWLNYINWIDVIKMFITAERTSNWKLHLLACQSMLNVFAAAGHFNYARTCRLYLQQMSDLEDNHPSLYQQFMQGNHTIRRSERMWAGLSCDLVIEQTLMKSAKGRGGLTRGRGMHDTVRHTWTSTMSECAGIHLAMITATGLLNDASDHAEVGEARMKRDCHDLIKVKEYLLANNPFRFFDVVRLVSLYSGVVAGPDDNVTCDIADEIGFQIQEKWNDLKFSEISLKKKDRVKTLAHLSNSCVIGNEQLHVDANRLFHRLVILGERSLDITVYFRYELTQYPTSLFCNGLMRKPDKPSLYKRYTADIMSSQFPRGSVFVVDGGCLLHKVKWVKGYTFEQLSAQYLSYVNSKFGHKVIVVYDGYGSMASTKDHEHARRHSKVSKIAPRVNPAASNQILFEREQFLANTENKADFVTMLVQCFANCGVQTFQSTGDADVDIVSVALQHALAGTSVVVYCDDTDVLSMLLHHRSHIMSDVYFWSETKKTKAGDKRINVSDLQTHMGKELCESILVLHALGGCDTTSSIFGIGKGKILSKLGADSRFRSVIPVLQDQNATQEQVTEAGMQLLSVLYGGKPSDSLDSLRYSAYLRLVSASLGRLQPEKLPPSSRAGYYHILRVHLQAVEWATLTLHVLNPTDWGWKLEEGRYCPIKTDLPIAPADILHIIRCGCKTGCGSALCSCQKNGLSCMSACNCYGSNCANSDNRLPVTEFDGTFDADLDMVMDSDIDWIAEETFE